MATTKKLTSSQTAALSLLAKGVADFYDLNRVGATGATSSWLVKHGLATETINSSFKEWNITDAGRVALAAGRMVVSAN